MKTSKAIILHTDFRDPGGVGNYYSKIRGKFSSNVAHFIVGSRPDSQRLTSDLLRFLMDYLQFYKLLKKSNIDIVMLNPSLDFKAIARDSLFLIISKLFHKQVIVFIRGWHKSFEEKITKYGARMFNSIYGRADHFIVLSKDFVDKLYSWGINKNITVERTIIDDDAIKKFDFGEALDARVNRKQKEIVFISRILKEKGIYETIEAIALARQEYPYVELNVAGTGPELESVKKFIASRGYSFVNILGYVRGHEKSKLQEQSYLLLYPTHGEGMPNTVIECLAFGLPVITCPVGGIPDFFIDRKNGFLTERRNPQVLSDLLINLIRDQALYRNISKHNYNMGKEFSACAAASRLDQLFHSLASH